MKEVLPDDAWRAFILPFFQAVATGIFAFIGGLAICMLGGWAWYYAAIGAALIAMLSWWGMLGWWSRIIKTLLIGDQVEYYEPETEPTQPAPAMPPIRVELVQVDEGGYYRGDYIDLPCLPEQARELASGLVSGEKFAVAAWTGKGRPFSRNQFEVLRVTLLQKGLIRWASPHGRTVGLELTPAGRAIFKRLASPPPDDRGQEYRQ